MANGFSINQLLQALQFAIIEAQEVAEDQHTRQIAEYFDAEGKPISVRLKLPSSSGGENGAVSYIEMDVPKITLIPQNSLVIKELEMEMEVPLGDMLVEDEDWTKDDKPPENMSDEEWDKLKMKNKLSRRRSKRAMVDSKLGRLQITGKGSFFGGRNKQTAKIRIKFEGQEPPEVMARIEQSLVKGIET